MPELEDASGINLEYEQIGALRIVSNTKHISNLRKKIRLDPSRQARIVTVRGGGYRFED